MLKIAAALDIAFGQCVWNAVVMEIVRLCHANHYCRNAIFSRHPALMGIVAFYLQFVGSSRDEAESGDVSTQASLYSLKRMPAGLRYLHNKIKTSYAT